MAGRLERGVRRRVFGVRRSRLPIVNRPCVRTGGRPDRPTSLASECNGPDELVVHRVAPPPGVRPGVRRPKELHFFDSLANRRLTDVDIDRYHRWFPRPSGTVMGEWTLIYVYEPWAVPMLAQAVPDVRDLLLLRDPIDRFHSGLAFGLSRGFSHIEATLEAYNRGLYTMQVERLIAHVPRSCSCCCTRSCAPTPRPPGGGRPSSSVSTPSASPDRSTRGTDGPAAPRRSGRAERPALRTASPLPLPIWSVSRRSCPISTSGAGRRSCRCRGAGPTRTRTRTRRSAATACYRARSAPLM